MLSALNSPGSQWDHAFVCPRCPTQSLIGGRCPLCHFSPRSLGAVLDFRATLPAEAFVYDALWDSSAQAHSEASGRLQQVDAAVLEVARGKVLDLGCGAGRLLLELRARGLDALGVDVSASACAQAALDNLPVLCADALALPFADCTFHSVVSAFAVFAHLPPASALAEAARVLRPGGWLALHTFGAVPLALGRLRRGKGVAARFHAHALLNPLRFARALTGAGLVLDRVWLGGRLPEGKRWLRALPPPSEAPARGDGIWCNLALAVAPLAQDVVVVARRAH
jgi:SAM-dependent methyltransferase